MIMIRKGKVLIVEDARSVIEVLTDILTEAGYEVASVLSGDDALDVLPSFKPDLVLLDVIMPGIDGYEVCARIRQDDTNKFIKIIMVSTETTLDKRLRGYEIGADDYISKPFDSKELLEKVRVFMRLKMVEDQLSDLNAKLNEQVNIRTQQLLDAEKMAAIGSLTAGIVHNLNNPLHAIMGAAQLLELKHPENPHIKLLTKAAGQMKRIITTILATSQKASQETSTNIDLNELINDQIELYKANSFFKHAVKLDLNFDPLPAYPGVYSHFSQSFGNLIKNAVDAMHPKGGGTLTINSRCNNNRVIIEIVDTGHGIDPSNIEKIFNPFYTTKPLSAEDDTPTGTGLGLASCKEMIESYGGSISVDSQLNQRTVFTVELPLKRNYSLSSS